MTRQPSISPPLEDQPQSATPPELEALATQPGLEEGGVVGPCPNCGTLMPAIRGSKQAVCPNCGFKDSCCF